MLRKIHEFSWKILNIIEVVKKMSIKDRNSFFGAIFLCSSWELRAIEFITIKGTFVEWGLISLNNFHNSR